MKIIFDKKILLEAISPAMSAVSNKNTITAIEGILFKTSGNDKCVICAYDLEKGMKTVIEAVVEEEGNYIINAVKLNQIVKIMPDGDITINVDEKNIVKIKSGRSEFELHALNGEDFPSLPELTSEKGFSIPQGILRTMINQTSFAIAQNDQRPAFNGAFFKIQGSKITIVACDSFRLALREQICELENKNEDGSELDLSFIIPGKTLTELLKIISDTDEMVTMLLARKHIVFAIGDILFFSRLIDSEYIDYERFIPKTNKIFVTIDCDNFKASLERASLVTEDKTLGQAKSHVKCSFEDELLKVTSVSVTGKVYDEILIQKDGENIEIGFNCKYLLDALRVCGVEKIKGSLSTPLMSMVIEPDKDEADENSNFTYLVLPIRMKD